MMNLKKTLSPEDAHNPVNQVNDEADVSVSLTNGQLDKIDKLLAFMISLDTCSFYNYSRISIWNGKCVLIIIIMV